MRVRLLQLVLVAALTTGIACGPEEPAAAPAPTNDVADGLPYADGATSILGAQRRQHRQLLIGLPTHTDTMTEPASDREHLRPGLSAPC
jgi:hypothetical protein